MSRDIYFTPLGGGQRVGASCYYLKLGDNNILLDAGVGGGRHHPSFEPLYGGLIRDMGDIHHIYISHAHKDHSGYLPEVMRGAPSAGVYMTEMTGDLVRYQLYERSNPFNTGEGYEGLAVMNSLDRIVNVAYTQRLYFKDYTATFYQAGHMPGAMMVLFEYEGRNILYTGDFTVDSTPLVDGCALPEGLKVDTMIMCGLHAKHPYHRRDDSSLYSGINCITKLISRGMCVMCTLSQLSKGVELIKAINTSILRTVPIYIDPAMEPIINRVEKCYGRILTEYDRIDTGIRPEYPHIYVGFNKPSGGRYQELTVDFSLHVDFGEMKRFIKGINPEYIYLVHCGREEYYGEETIEQAILWEGECGSQFTFAEEGCIYKL